MLHSWHYSQAKCGLCFPEVNATPSKLMMNSKMINSLASTAEPPSLSQCDQIGRFLKILSNKFAYKSSPKGLVTFGQFSKKINWFNKLLWILFSQLLERFGQLFNPASIHTDCDPVTDFARKVDGNAFFLEYQPGLIC